MNITLINKVFFTFLCLVILSACSSTKSVYNKIKPTKYEVPIIENLVDQKIILNSSYSNKTNYENKITLNELKNKNQYQRGVIIIKDKVFALSKNNNIKEFDLNSGELISTKIINFINIKSETIVSFNYLNNSFILALKSGIVLNIDLNGELIWKFESNKILNTPLFVYGDQIIALYVDEIYGISSEDGSLIWHENYTDIPVYQAKGGQLVNFLNILFFILPNNRVGSIDLDFGTENNFIFNEIPLISPINNKEDKIHTFDNYFTYLDEGKYLYTVDILTNEFNLFKKNIKSSSSNIFFNNALILKEGKYLHAINIYDGKSFWLIEDRHISQKSSIIAIRSIEENIEIFLKNGDVLVIHNKKLLEINNVGIKNIKSIFFKDTNIIVNTDSGKTVVF
ncbi:MAG: PQQ-binding-like beta-propeller repeat protein [Pelagibacteraceae bacterium]|nr:PQQ-binding-like beta-propeller repeat protein [Pelagibacteraceae bacterium]